MTDVAVELLMDGLWVDVAAQGIVRTSPALAYSSGVSLASARTTSGSASFTLDNATGASNPYNPTSQFYGIVTRNTPMRIVYPGVAEDFEDTSYAFTISTFGDASWARASDQAYRGTYSFKSGAIGDSEYCAWSVDVPAGCNTLSFAYRVSSEYGYDFFAVYVDGFLAMSNSGEVDWTLKNIDVSDIETVSFYYLKDSVTSSGDDAAWVDQVRFDDVRWSGEISEWRPQRAVGSPPKISAIAGGIMRRYSQGVQVVFSALLSTVLAATDLYAYWPLTDGASDDVGGSLVSGQPGLHAETGAAVTWAAVDGPAGAPDKLPELATSSGGNQNALQATLADGPVTTWQVSWVARANTGSTDDVNLLPFTWSSSNMSWTTSLLRISGSTTWVVSGYDAASGNSIGASYAFDFDDAAWHHYAVDARQNGATLELLIYLDNVYVAGDSDTITADGINLVRVNISEPPVAGASFSAGHLVIRDVGAPNLSDASAGYPGELCGVRFKRFCLERGISATVKPEPNGGDTVMGPQPPGTVVDTLQLIADTDGGMFVESLHEPGFTFRTLNSLVSQTARVTASWLDDLGGGDLEPVSSDRDVRNDITVKQADGSRARAVLTSGPLSVLDPPNGVGRYATEIALNHGDLSQVQQAASWLLHLKTTTDVWYASIPLQLSAGTLDVSKLRIGDRLDVTNVPITEIVGDVSVIVSGITETIRSHTRTMVISGVSAEPYSVGLADDAGWLDCGASTLDGAHAADATTLTLAIADNCTWAHDDGDYGVIVAGEVVTVTAVGTPTGSPGAWSQTLTVTRSVNGVVRALPDGAEVHVAEPFILALT